MNIPLFNEASKEMLKNLCNSHQTTKNLMIEPKNKFLLKCCGSRSLFYVFFCKMLPMPCSFSLQPKARLLSNLPH